MGTWGPGSFENDDALDFVNVLISGRDLQKLNDIFQTIIRNDQYIQADDSQMAIAAGEVVVLIVGKSAAESLPADLIEWHEKQILSVDNQLIARAIEAIEKIFVKSELSELWEDDPLWQNSVRDLIQRLKSAAD